MLSLFLFDFDLFFEKNVRTKCNKTRERETFSVDDGRSVDQFGERQLSRTWFYTFVWNEPAYRSCWSRVETLLSFQTERKSFIHSVWWNETWGSLAQPFFSPVSSSLSTFFFDSRNHGDSNERKKKKNACIDRVQKTTVPKKPGRFEFFFFGLFVLHLHEGVGPLASSFLFLHFLLSASYKTQTHRVGPSTASRV